MEQERLRLLTTLSSPARPEDSNGAAFAKHAVMEWRDLQERSDLVTVDELSQRSPVVILKHSTRCLLSSMVLARLERAWKAEHGHTWFFLDLLRYRQVSDLVADHYGVRHASPQILVIDQGKCIYTASHNGIVYDELQAEIAAHRSNG